MDGEGRNWPERMRDATRGDPGAAVHLHSLDRLNAINDSLNEKKLVVSASGDKTLRLWDPATGGLQSILDTSIPSPDAYSKEAYFM